jgi:IS30 family transposase
MAMERRKKPAPRIPVETWELIESKLREDWSPEQISGWLKRNNKFQVSHESIYLYILADKRTGGDLHKHLRCQKKRRKRYGSHDRRGKLPNRVSIDERPGIVDRRQRIGDWEVDTIIGKGRRQAIVTLTERKSRFALLRKVERRKADLVREAVIDLLQPVVDRAHTITGDNGKEFAEHERIAKELDIDFFFAHPYAAWERGTNENMNGLVRQYIPKNRDFALVTDEELITIIDKLNHRPRKCLDFKTPLEVFFEHFVALIC